MAVLIEAGKMCELGVETLKKEVSDIADRIGQCPQFVIINASDDPGNARYVKNKVQEGQSIGINVNVLRQGEDCTTEDILDNIEYCRLHKIPVIFQMPAYPHLDTKRILESITPEIDADGFTKEWLGEVAMGNDNVVAPATPKGVINLLNHFNVEIGGKTALVIGRSNHVGKPMSTMLINRGATVITANSRTENLQDLVQQSDIIVSCVGKTHLISPYDVKEGAVLIGVGFTYIEGKQVLDFDIDAMLKESKASLVTNRVRCTGKATVHSLIDNVVQLYRMNYK